MHWTIDSPPCVAVGLNRAWSTCWRPGFCFFCADNEMCKVWHIIDRINHTKDLVNSNPTEKKRKYAIVSQHTTLHTNNIRIHR